MTRSICKMLRLYGSSQLKRTWKAAGRKPRDLADLLAQRLGAHTSVTEAAVAGPGFINLHLDREFWLGRLRDVLEAGIAYGSSEIGAGRPVNVGGVASDG